MMRPSLHKQPLVSLLVPLLMFLLKVQEDYDYWLTHVRNCMIKARVANMSEVERRRLDASHTDPSSERLRNRAHRVGDLYMSMSTVFLNGEDLPTSPFWIQLRAECLPGNLLSNWKGSTMLIDLVTKTFLYYKMPPGSEDIDDLVDAANTLENYGADLAWDALVELSWGECWFTKRH